MTDVRELLRRVEALEAGNRSRGAQLIRVAATSAQVATAMDMPSKNACAILSELEREGFVTSARVHSETARRHVRTYTAVGSAA